MLAHWLLPLQQAPLAQSLGAAQLVLHAVTPQTYGVQCWVDATAQLPAEQLTASVSVPLVQLAATHCAVG